MGIPTHAKVIVMEMLATATVTMIVMNLVTAAMMSAKNAICQIANNPSPAMATVVDRLQAAAGVIVLVRSRLMTAALMSAMNAISTARRGAGGGFSQGWGV